MHNLPDKNRGHHVFPRVLAKVVCKPREDTLETTVWVVPLDEQCQGGFPSMLLMIVHCELFYYGRDKEGTGKATNTQPKIVKIIENEKDWIMELPVVDLKCVTKDAAEDGRLKPQRLSSIDLVKWVECHGLV